MVGKPQFPAAHACFWPTGKVSGTTLKVEGDERLAGFRLHVAMEGDNKNNNTALFRRK